MKFATLALALSGVTASAHHSVDRTYDLKREVEVLGQDGNTQMWALEFPKARGTLLKQGIQPGTLKAGDQVTITINPPLKSTANRGNIVTFRRESDGFEWRAKAKRNQS